MENVSPVSKWPFQHTKMAILRKWGYVLKWPFWGNGGMVANSANSGAFYTILTNIWHPWRSWVHLHVEVQLVLWEKAAPSTIAITPIKTTIELKRIKLQIFSVFSSCFIWSSSMSPLFKPKAKCVQQVKKDRTARKKPKTPTTTSRIPPMCIILKIASFPQILSMAPCEKCEVKIEPPINVVMNEKKMRGQERHHILLLKTLFEMSIFQIFWKVHFCDKFLSIRLATWNFGYLLILYFW